MSQSGLFFVRVSLFLLSFVFLFLYLTQMKLPRFNYFTITSTPLIYVYSINGQESQGSICSVQPVAIGYCT